MTEDATVTWLNSLGGKRRRKDAARTCARRLQTVADLSTRPLILTVPGRGFVHIDDITEADVEIYMATPDTELAQYYSRMLRRGGVLRDRLGRLGMDPNRGVVIPGEQEFVPLDRLSQDQLAALENASDRLLVRAYVAVTGVTITPPRDRDRAVRSYTPPTTRGTIHHSLGNLV